jgi:hypothetical protein
MKAAVSTNPLYKFDKRFYDPSQSGMGYFRYSKVSMAEGISSISQIVLILFDGEYSDDINIIYFKGTFPVHKEAVGEGQGSRAVFH